MDVCRACGGLVAVLVSALACQNGPQGGAQGHDAQATSVPAEPALPSSESCGGTREQLITLIDEIARWVAAEEYEKVVACAAHVDELQRDGLELLVYPDLVLALDRRGYRTAAMRRLARIEATLTDRTAPDGRMFRTLGDAANKLAVGVLGEALVYATLVVQDGEPGEAIDERIVREVRAGMIRRDRLVSLARKNGARRGVRRAVRAKWSSFKARMIGYVGAEGLARQLHTVMREYGHSSPRYLKAVLRKWRLSREEIEEVVELVALLPDDPEHVLARRAFTRDAIARRLREIVPSLNDEQLRQRSVGVYEKVDAH